MNKRDTLKPKSTPARGILHLPKNQQLAGLKRFEPSQELARFVEHYWAVTWVEQPRVVRETVPFPSIQMTFEHENCRIHGIYQTKFSRTIEGSGRVLGVKFRPGAFRAFSNSDVSDLTGMIVEPAMVFGNSMSQLEHDVLISESAAEAFMLIDRYLQNWNPVATSELRLVEQIMERVESDRSVVRADQLAREFSVGLRTLQRVFRSHVGVGPKWVIQRLRLIETAERMRNDQSKIDFAGLALELGFSDQAHLIRAFKLFVGMPPGQYQRSLQK